MRPTFEGVLGGFDTKASPKWQIIGNGEVAVVWLNNGAGTDVTVRLPGIIKIEETIRKAATPPSSGSLTKLPAVTNDFRIFKLTGTMVGNTFIDVRKNGKLLEQLEVCVADILPIAVTFNYVSDNATHSTKRDKKALDIMILGTNNILMQEASLKVVKHNVRDLSFDRNLGKVVMFQNVWDIIAGRRDKSATFNVFFVWEYEQDDTPKIDNAEAAAKERVVLFEDNVGVNDYVILVHELVHLMGLPHFQKPDYVMNETAEGFKFTKMQVLEMRRILKHIMKLSQ